MSRDSSRSYIHLHASWHADLFEEFTQNLSQFSSSNSSQSHQLPTHSTLVSHYHPSSTIFPSSITGSSAAGGGLNPSLANPLAPGHSTLLPPEDIPIPPQHQPPNPEDEDDVVPDQHAAFGITRAMRLREERERAWKDFDTLKGLVRGDSIGQSRSGTAEAGIRGTRVPSVSTTR